MRQMAVARECSAAWLTRLDTTRLEPVWRYNRMKFTDRPSVNSVSVQVENGWGGLANQPVTFTVPETGASCTATTDETGHASCAIHPLRPFKDTVTATFAGAQGADFVDLPAKATSDTVCSNGTCK